MGFSLQSLGKVKMLTSHLDEFFYLNVICFLDGFYSKQDPFWKEVWNVFFVFVFFSKEAFINLDTKSVFLCSMNSSKLNLLSLHRWL